MDEILNPDDPTLDVRRRGLELEYIELAKPPLMAGKGNRPDAIRKNYISNLHTLQLEGFPVTEATPSITFWEYVSTLDERTRAKLNLTKNANQSL